MIAALLMLQFMAAVPVIYAGQKEEAVVNVLCYHRFVERKAAAKTIKGDSYYLSPELFESHLEYLRDNAVVISMDDYVDALESGKDLKPRTVVLTADDGYRSLYTEAFPLLKKYNMPMTIYLYNNFFPGGANALTASMVKEMAESGLITFGSHSATHPILTSRKKKGGSMDDAEYADKLYKEIIGSKEYLEKKSGLAIETMAYPYGAYSAEVWEFAEKAGYRAAFSVVDSYNTTVTPRFALKRTMLYTGDKSDKIKKLLEKKPLKTESSYPSDGEIIQEQRPVLKAVLADDSMLNTATVKFMMGRVVLEKDSKYDADKKELSYVYERDLDKGVHTARVIAQGKEGGYYEYSWLFIIGKSLDKETMKLKLEKKETDKEE